jgi:hypothetical protein
MNESCGGMVIMSTWPCLIILIDPTSVEAARLINRAIRIKWISDGGRRKHGHEAKTASAFEIMR